jgi:NAD(P)-dependent dehydrogenase (short-subunit alcohol dehydrogenase family)
MSYKLADLHAVVTGASRGIGADIARTLAAQGVRVSLLARDAGGLKEVAQEIGAEKAEALQADISDGGSVAAAMAAARERFGPITILVNNAGQAASAKFTDTGPELWERILGVNLHGTYLCTRAVISDMLKKEFGRIVNIASTAGLRGGAYLSAYTASKHAVVGLTRALALEYATRNITVNAICPGYVDTQIVRDAVANISQRTGRTDVEARATLLATNPQRRLVSSAEVASACLWLVQPDALGVTGHSLIISGGEVT